MTYLDFLNECKKKEDKIEDVKTIKIYDIMSDNISLLKCYYYNKKQSIFFIDINITPINKNNVKLELDKFNDKHLTKQKFELFKLYDKILFDDIYYIIKKFLM